MAPTVPQQIVAPPPPRPTGTLAALEEARRATLALVAHLDDADLERTLSPIMSPLAWDLAHIAAYEDLWLAHRYAGLQLLRGDLAELYDAFETPRSKRSEVELLNAPQARDYMEEVRARVAAAAAREGVGDGFLHELVLRHELQHTETMRQTMALAGLLPPGEPRLRALTGAEGWLEFPAGTFTMGAPTEHFAYDNERPRHLAPTSAFRIARRPVTNASWLRFSEGGGYERREWWSDEGWAWKEEYDITHHPSVTASPLQAAVCHVSWFEADAFARAHDARLPTEAEWERAATSDHPALEQGGAQGGGGLGDSGHPMHRPDDRERAYTAAGPLEGAGQVWEWTSSTFHGYPGFVAHPYREYSEVFFGDDYRVLRGGSWATSPRVASPTFRNWDYPLRRQIFAGLRLARDVV
jgi:iron(II)-dependent oxidoreductase